MVAPQTINHPKYGLLEKIDPEAYGVEQNTRIKKLLAAGWGPHSPEHSSDLRVWTHPAWGPKTFRDAWDIYECDGIANTPK
jgi:hypothetical protein